MLVFPRALHPGACGFRDCPHGGGAAVPAGDDKLTGVTEPGGLCRHPQPRLTVASSALCLFCSRPVSHK